MYDDDYDTEEVTADERAMIRMSAILSDPTIHLCANRDRERIEVVKWVPGQKQKVIHETVDYNTLHVRVS